MDSIRKGTFNKVYSGRGYYYGLEVRPEFSEYFSGMNLEGKKALDIGCGEGRYSFYLAEKGCSVDAVDRSRQGLAKLEKTASEKNLPVSVHEKDIADFSFPEAEYDIIVAATILDHLDAEPRRRAAAGIKSALKPGGILYANVFTVADPGYKLKKIDSKDASGSGVSDTAGCIRHYFSLQELKSVFADFRHLKYFENMEPDHSHGRPHFHGWACLLARKPES